MMLTMTALLEQPAAVALVNTRNQFNWSALHILAGNADKSGERAFMVKMLVEKRADLEIVTNKGKTPLHSAAGTGNVDCFEMLVKLGANLKARDYKGVSVWDVAWMNMEIRDVFKRLGIRKDEGPGASTLGENRFSFVYKSYGVKPADNAGSWVPLGRVLGSWVAWLTPQKKNSRWVVGPTNCLLIVFVTHGSAHVRRQARNWRQRPSDMQEARLTMRR